MIHKWRSRKTRLMRATVQSMVCHVETLSNPAGSIFSQYFGFENMGLFPTLERNRIASNLKSGTWKKTGFHTRPEKNHLTKIQDWYHLICFQSSNPEKSQVAPDKLCVRLQIYWGNEKKACLYSISVTDRLCIHSFWGYYTS